MGELRAVRAGDIPGEFGQDAISVPNAYDSPFIHRGNQELCPAVNQEAASGLSYLKHRHYTGKAAGG
jgi:hypothetical protein